MESFVVSERKYRPKGFDEVVGRSRLQLYGIDTEIENGIPKDAQKLNKLLASADGLVISLTELGRT